MNMSKNNRNMNEIISFNTLSRCLATILQFLWLDQLWLQNNLPIQPISKGRQESENKANVVVVFYYKCWFWISKTKFFKKKAKAFRHALPISESQHLSPNPAKKSHAPSSALWVKAVWVDPAWHILDTPGKVVLDGVANCNYFAMRKESYPSCLYKNQQKNIRDNQSPEYGRSI